MGDILPGGSIASLRDLVANARAISSDIRNHRAGTDTTIQRRRGPSASKLRLRYYLLPDRSDVPTLSGKKDAALIAAHHQCQYGFLGSHATKKHSCALGLSIDSYNAFLCTLYTNLPPTTCFRLHTCDKRKNLKTVEHHNELHKYSGVVFLKIDDGHISDSTENETVHSDGVDIDDTETHHIVPATPPSVTEPINHTTPPIATESVNPTTPVVASELTNNATTSITLETITTAAESRRRIIADQDIAFAASLRIDREREQLQRDARERLSLRSRRRRQQRLDADAEAEQRRARIIEEMAEEPADGVCLIFRHQSADLYRRFNITDTCKYVHTFVAASVGRECRLVGPDGQELYNDCSRSLQDCGYVRNSTLHAEEIEPADIGDGAEDDHDDEFTDARETLPTESPSHGKGGASAIAFDELLTRTAGVRENLLCEKKSTVRREELVNDLIDAYQADSDLQHHHIQMKVEGEPALDLDGVKREVYCTFFMMITARFFSGVSQCVPRMDPELVCAGMFHLLGKILVHAFVLVGYFPIRISQASVVAMLTRTCSLEIIMSSLNDYISPQTKKSLKKVMCDEELTAGDRLTLMSFFADNGMTRTPPINEYRQCIQRCAEMALVYKPLYALGSMFQGINTYPGLWVGIGEETINEMYRMMTPTVQEVLQRLNFEHSDDAILRTAEERVKNFLEHYIEHVVCEQGLPKLLQYWTASNTLCVPNLHVAFNSQEGVMRRPFVNACVAQLNLSRMYVSVGEFVEEFNTYINSTAATEFDSW